MLGYCATGNWNISIAPASISTSPNTHANTGRSMKNRDMTLATAEGSGFVGVAGRGFAGRGRPHLGTGSDVLQPVNDHPLARLQAAGDDPLVAHRLIGLNDAQLRLVAIADHEHG